MYVKEKRTMMKEGREDVIGMKGFVFYLMSAAEPL